MGHYYTNDSKVESNIKKLSYTFKGKVLNLETDTGIFCKDHIDFGTNILLNSIPDFDDGFKLLDVGCGYGLIGLCVGKAYPKSSIDMIDVNLRAIEIANRNKKNNGISNAEIFESNVYEKISSQYNYILTNPPIRAGKLVVHDIVLNGSDYLVNGGKIYVVIQKKQGAPSLIEKMNEVYNEVNIINKEKGYFIIEGVKA